MARNQAFAASFALVATLASGCAAPHTDGAPAPGTSRTAADSAPPPAATADTDPGADPDFTAEEPAAPPPRRPLPAPAIRPVPPVAVPLAAGPYRVEILGDASNRLPTFRHAGRTYVLGTIGSRYRIHVTNPTARRVEAVVSVDGLDAIDGTTADFVNKSGYVIAPYGDTTIDGFRTSMQDVATFRFSSVRDSYAAREGSDRNVGVIGVAFFTERERPPQLPRPRPVTPSYDSPGRSSGAPSHAHAPASRAPAGLAEDDMASSAPVAPAEPAPPKRERAGLGTEFGEDRYSAVEYTEFQRADARHPSAVAELRYNDRDGLIALGIPLRPPVPTEQELRETASPFPANRFASAPPPR